MDPGVPETGEYLARFCAEVTRKYDIDGLHFDYIRYPEKSWGFRDEKTYAKYGNGQPKAQWRRDNVTRCVRLIHDTVKAIKPWVRLSCSPVGKYADLPRQSSSGWNARDAVSQDAKLWLREGLMDMVFPMMYFDGRHFYPFVVDWNEDSGGRPIVPGLGAYLLSGKERGWSLNIASVAAFQPVPYQAEYAATKAFVLSLSRALWKALLRIPGQFFFRESFQHNPNILV